MPMHDDDPKYFQNYLMGNFQAHVTTRQQYNFIEQAVERAIMILLENLLECQNQLIRLMKRVSQRLQNDLY